jgi:hypothetical protein
MGCCYLLNIGANLVPVSLLVLLMVQALGTEWLMVSLQQHSNFKVILLIQSLQKQERLSTW